MKRIGLVLSGLVATLAVTAGAQEPQRVYSPSGTFEFHSETGFASGRVAATPDSAFRALRDLLAAAVDPLPGRAAMIELRFSGDAVDIPGGRNDRLPCSTTGRLELQIVDSLRARFPDSGS